MINVMNDDVAKVEIYESADGKAQIDVRLEHDTLWLSQAQLATLFERLGYHRVASKKYL